MSSELHFIHFGSGQGKQTYDFTTFYKSTEESSENFKRKSEDNITPEPQDVDKNDEVKQKKKRKKSRKLPETPTKNTNLKLKGILKVTSTLEDDTDSKSNHTIKENGLAVEPQTTKPNKRSKSCSFNLDENPEIVTKKTKSEKSSDGKTIRHSRKENAEENTNQYRTKVYRNQKHSVNIHKQDSEETKAVDKSKLKKLKRLSQDTEQPAEANTEEVVKKVKKSKKKKHQELETEENETKPKTDVLTEDLQNLKIGDNPHTLTDLLDEMTVVDKTKREKKPKKKDKKKVNKDTETETEKEEKEKVKWSKRKWNKDKKGGVEGESLETTVVVENLPISIMLTYKKLLTDHFVKYGLIKSIGIAELYPTEESKPVFTTTIKFYSDGAATEALKENNSIFEGSYIRVRQPLPASETTIVLRSYSELNEQTVCSLFTGLGKIRNIRLIVKGRKSLSTAFVEFDTPESAEKALQKATDIKIGKKKVHVARYQVRDKKQNDEEPKEKDTDSG